MGGGRGSSVDQGDEGGRCRGVTAPAILVQYVDSGTCIDQPLHGAQHTLEQANSKQVQKTASPKDK